MPEQSDVPTQNAPAMFNHGDWVRYSEAKTTAAGLALLGGVIAVAGLVISTNALHVEQSGEWFTMDANPTRMFAGAFVSVLGITLFSFAEKSWRRARRIREIAERRSLVDTAFTVTMASVVMKVLQKLKEEAEADV